MSVSVCTIVRGRADHLARLVDGLNRQTRAPDELVIGWMQPDRAALPPTAFRMRHVHVAGDAMPLAAARNAAAAAASGRTLVFLDVDCIPSATLVARYAAAGGRGVRLGDVLYLPADLPAVIDDGVLDTIGVRHPAKPDLAADEIRPTPDHGELWGLSFALEAADWRAAAGMDEAYVGYGGEETDFAARLERAGVAMVWLGGARAYHQHHAISIPPYQHFDDIVRNAALFHARWGRWCMDYWLGQFADAGLIALGDDAITVLRRPTARETAAARQPGDVRFS